MSAVVAADREATGLRDPLLAIRMLFLVNGIAAASWAPLVPAAKAGLGLSDGALGSTLLFGGIGTLIGMPLVSAGMVKFGCRPVVAVGSCLLVAVLPCLLAAPSQAFLALALLMFGLSLAMQGIAGNAFAVDIEKAQGRPLMSSFHAFYSLGGLAGAFFVSRLLKFGVSPVGCMLTVGVVLAAAAATFTRWLPAESKEPRSAGPVFAMPKGAAWLIGFFCFISFLGEGSVGDWSANFLHDARGFDLGDAASGYIAFAVAMTVCRLTGDAIIRRFGRVRVLAVGAALSAFGIALAVTVPLGEAGVLGFAILGLGAGNTVPILFSAAGRLPNMPPTVSIPAVATLGCIGFLVGPASIGFIADVTGLPTALFGIAVLFALIAFGARAAR